MSPEIRESDWKLFRQLHEVALDRFCSQVLSEMSQIASDATAAKSNHERYLAMWDRLRSRDKELSNVFNGARRWVALEQLAMIQARQLLTKEEMSRFSEETRKIVSRYLRTSLR
jgi:hypothetical protein